MTDQEQAYRLAMALRYWWAGFQLHKGRRAVLTPAQLAFTYRIRDDQDLSVFDV